MSRCSYGSADGPFWETRSKQGSNKQNVGIFGRFEASRMECLGTLYKKSPKSEIQTSSDKATMKRFFSSGCCRKLAPKLPQAGKVICQREEAGRQGSASQVHVRAS